MTIDELADYGASRTDDDAIRSFLSGQGVGVLGLPAEGAPLVRPLSFWFDGEEQSGVRHLGLPPGFEE